MKKGFTLVELMVVIVILGLLATIVYPSVISIINTSKESANESQQKIVIKAAKEWGVEHPTKLPNNSCYITVKNLIDEGYIENEVIDPKGGIFGGGIEIKFDSNQYVYTYVESSTYDSCL